jgi:hypothetical protein
VSAHGESAAGTTTMQHAALHTASAVSGCSSAISVKRSVTAVLLADEGKSLHDARFHQLCLHRSALATAAVTAAKGHSSEAIINLPAVAYRKRMYSVRCVEASPLTWMDTCHGAEERHAEMPLRLLCSQPKPELQVSRQHNISHRAMPTSIT